MRCPRSRQSRPCGIWTKRSTPSLTGSRSIRRSRRSTVASRPSTRAFAFAWDGSTLTLARLPEPLPIRWSRPRPLWGGKPSTITLSRDPSGRYFVSFLVDEDIAPLPDVSNTVGIDLGLEDVVTLSTGRKRATRASSGRERRSWRGPSAGTRRSKRRSGIERRPGARWRASMPASPTGAVIFSTS